MSDSDNNKAKGEATDVVPERNTKRPTLVDLKNGKIIFKQKSVSFEKQSETLQEIVKFREMLEAHIESQAPPFTTFPDEHRPLIAKLAHESDKTLSTLSKHIRHELLPAQDEDEERDDKSTSGSAALPLNLVEAAVKSIMSRNNYGLDAANGAKVPAALCVWRWEVKEEHRDWLPKNGRDKAELRMAERVQAKQDLTSLFGLLPQIERDAIMDPKGASKLPKESTTTKFNFPDAPRTIDLTTPDSKGAVKSQQKRRAEEEENDTQSDTAGNKPRRANKAADPDKVAKEKEKLEKKVAKAEKERRAKDAQSKSRSIMTNFFAKPKAKTTPRALSKEVEESVAGPSNFQSEFEKIFKPFVLKRGSQLAPINWFQESKKRRGGAVEQDGDVIIIDEETRGDVQMDDTQPVHDDVTAMSMQEHLQTILSSLPPSLDPLRLPRPSSKPSTPHLKTYSPISVRDLLSQLSEAEVAGDISLVRTLLSRLRNRTLLPAKVLIFTEDARPGYFGTWTRSSRIIGSRTPFAKDALVFDYSYDSGEEWEDEPAGDADDVADDGEDEDGEDDADSDADSWLVDDDREEIDVSLEDVDLSPVDLPSLPIAPIQKRKAEGGEKKLGKKRKVVVPLVPFARGPCWEPAVGTCEYEPFNPYRIQLFNDTPFPIDPFTFVSSCMEDKRAEDKRANAKASSSTNDGFAVPSLPDRLTAPSITGSLAATPTPGTTTKKTPFVPKYPFPDTHLPFLLTKITTLQAASLPFLIEAIYQDLKVHKVKKNAIEAKIREVSERCKEKKVWVIKPDLKS